MPDETPSNLPILDDIIKPGAADKDVRPPSDKAQDSIAFATPAPAPAVTPEPANRSHPPAKQTPPDDSTEVAEPFLEDVIASYRPNIDSLTDDILGNILAEVEPLLRRRIRESLKRHFPNYDDID